MRQQSFSEIHRAQSVDVQTHLRELIIRARFFQLRTFAKSRIIDQNINLRTTSSNPIGNLSNALARGHIQLHIPNSVLALESPPKNFPPFLRLNASGPNLRGGIAPQEDFDQLVTDPPAGTRHQHPQRKIHRVYYNLKKY